MRALLHVNVLIAERLTEASTSLDHEFWPTDVWLLDARPAVNPAQTSSASPINRSRHRASGGARRGRCVLH